MGNPGRAVSVCAGIDDGEDFAYFDREENAVYFQDDRNQWCSAVKASETVIGFSEGGQPPDKDLDFDFQLTYRNQKPKITVRAPEGFSVYTAAPEEITLCVESD